jgi:hypothetical protein
MRRPLQRFSEKIGESDQTTSRHDIHIRGLWASFCYLDLCCKRRVRTAAWSMASIRRNRFCNSFRRLRMVVGRPSFSVEPLCFRGQYHDGIRDRVLGRLLWCKGFRATHGYHGSIYKRHALRRACGRSTGGTHSLPICAQRSKFQETRAQSTTGLCSKRNSWRHRVLPWCSPGHNGLELLALAPFDSAPPVVAWHTQTRDRLFLFNVLDLANIDSPSTDLGLSSQLSAETRILTVLQGRKGLLVRFNW